MKSWFAFVLFSVLVAVAWVGCYTGDATAPAQVTPGDDASAEGGGDAAVVHASLDYLTPDAERQYRSINEVFEGSQGIYRGCGPNNGVCHNASTRFPALATLGSVLLNIDAPCNQSKDDPKEMHDLCERPGDKLKIEGTQTTQLEIAYVVNGNASAGKASRKWDIVFAVAPPAIDGARLSVARPDGEILAITDNGATAILDGKTIHLTLPDAPAPDAGDATDYGLQLATSLAKAGVPNDPAQIQVGDPNQNGVFGAALGGRLIRAGDPTKSYLFLRLTDVKAGPLMPRANCCYWTKTTVRALWCWVAGLKPDASNAMAPIDYAACPTGPADSMTYPEPGPTCETDPKNQGLCPAVPNDGPTDEPTWSNLYPHVFKPSCTGSGCHSGAAPAQGLDFGSEDAAFRTIFLNGRVTPRDLAQSKLYTRISPDMCPSASCATMPLGQSPLPLAWRDLVKTWIVDGARR